MKLLRPFLLFGITLAVACSGSGGSTGSPSPEEIKVIAMSTNTPVPTITPRPARVPPIRVSPTPGPTPVALAGWDPDALQAPATPPERFDLSQLDATATEAKITELLLDGWIMYWRQSRFNPRNPLGLDIDFQAIPLRTAAEIIRFDYPETTRFDTWVSAEPSGQSTWLTYELTMDGDLLNSTIRLQDSMARVDIATGLVMKNPDSFSYVMQERAIGEIVASYFTAIELARKAGQTEVPSQYLNRPSVIFGDTFEFQIANRFIRHEIRERTENDGSITLLGEAHTLDFAVFPPGSMPEIPSWPPDGS